MNILLHICCAPCSIFPIDLLRKEGHAVGGYFFNPNIHPYSEYQKRRSEVEKYAKSAGLNVTYGDYTIEEYFQHITYNEAIDARCPMCWWLRARESAKFAVENGFESYTTTLFGSPYQNHDIVRNIWQDVAVKAGLKLYYEDFRLGFKSAHEKARSGGMYCQNYCGCVYSEKERLDSKGRKNIKKAKNSSAV